MSDLGEMLNFGFAEHIEAEWDVYMEEGYTIQEATTQIIDQYEDMLKDILTHLRKMPLFRFECRIYCHKML